METFTDKAFSEEKIELSDAKPVYLPDGFKLINQGTSQVARSIRSYMSSRWVHYRRIIKTRYRICCH